MARATRQLHEPPSSRISLSAMRTGGFLAESVPAEDDRTAPREEAAKPTTPARVAILRQFDEQTNKELPLSLRRLNFHAEQ